MVNEGGGISFEIGMSRGGGDLVLMAPKSQ